MEWISWSQAVAKWEWLAVGALLLLIWIYAVSRIWSGRKRMRAGERKSVELDWPFLEKEVKRRLHEAVYADLHTFGVTVEVYERIRNDRKQLKQALVGCSGGDVRDKQYVRQFIFDMLQMLLEDETAEQVEAILETLIPFSKRQMLTDQEKFDILLYHLKKKHGAEALHRLVADIQPPGNQITAGDVQAIFERERPRLHLSDKLMLISQRLYQQLLGFGAVDEIREMNIDGVSGGVSGAGYDSIWIFYKGRSLRLAGLSFGTVEELKRVCLNIYKYNFPGQLSERNGYKVNLMADGSRVVVVRPPFAESWSFFVRKFDVPKATLGQLVQGRGADFMMELLTFLVKGARVTAVTGAQGSGKTTLLMALVGEIDSGYTVRVQEMAFELRLRTIYPERNILSFRETEEISGQQGLDIQKKTDGTVNIIGEVASDPVAAWMIQAAQVASLFTLFTHHAKTFTDLVYSLRNSLLKTGVFSQEQVAEQQVLQVLHFNVHLVRATDGTRYIERVTECAPAAEDVQLGPGREVAGYRDGKYVPLMPITEAQQEQMARQMSERDRQQFRLFLDAHWYSSEEEQLR